MLFRSVPDMSPLKGESIDRLGNMPSSSPPPNLASPSKPGASGGIGYGRTLPPLTRDVADMDGARHGANGIGRSIPAHSVPGGVADDEDDEEGGFDLARYVLCLLWCFGCVPVRVDWMS